jgi:predicted nucleic acid-binding protein
MKSALDSSFLVAALCAADPDHISCRKVLAHGGHSVFAHCLAETFSTLTGGRLGFRVPAVEAASLIRRQVAPKLRIVSLEADDLLDALEEADARGVRGGAVYDYLHLVAARKAGAKRLFTLNLPDFLSFHRPGDPEIHPP